MFWLSEEAEKLRERLSTFETAARAKVSKEGMLPATRMKQKKINFDARREQTRVELDAWNV